MVADIDYEKIRKPIQDIIDFANTIEEGYRKKCFEILLMHYLSVSDEINIRPLIQQKQIGIQARGYPPELRTFMEQNAITEEIINKLFSREGGEARPIYKVDEKKAVAQIQIALLTAFENALVTPHGSLEFPMKAVRARCAEYNVYDGNDFMFNFKNRAGLFSNIDSDVVRLSTLGKSELANLMVALSKH